MLERFGDMSWRKILALRNNSMKHYTKEEALERAKEFGLYDEVATAMGFGLSPNEALQDWDIYPYNK